MILWLNGTFGAGKTTTAASIREQAPHWHDFDPEWVGYMLQRNLRGVELADFQDLEAWRRLVPVVAQEIIEVTHSDLLTVQTVLVESYWTELASGMQALGLEVFHVVLAADDDALRVRIDADEIEVEARGWRHDHLDAWNAARPWLTAAADLVVDTTDLTAAEAALRILAAL